MERAPDDNSNERMADRPRPDLAASEASTAAVDDTAPEIADSVMVDDV